MANKVKFGLSNVHVLFIESYNAETKTYTYEKKNDNTTDNIMALPGAVSISLAPQGDTAEFYADNIAYFSQAANTGYQGDLQLAMIPDWFRQKALGETVDDNGVQVEASDATIKPFVLLFEINGDVTKTRYALYRNTVARPSIAGQTVESSITPSTDTMTITAMPRENDHITKGFISGDDATHATTYNAWFTSMHEPTFAD